MIKLLFIAINIFTVAYILYDSKKNHRKKLGYITALIALIYPFIGIVIYTIVKKLQISQKPIPTILFCPKCGKETTKKTCPKCNNKLHF